MKPTPEHIAALAEQANTIRMRDLIMVNRAGMGHIGGDFSAIDILTALYFSVLNVDPARPDWPDRDRFVLSKGHVAGALYTTLAYRGFLPLEALDTFLEPMSPLSGHPDRNKVKGVEANTGPLGHGLPIAVGIAIGAKLDKATYRTFVLTGDGELQEGSNWEAAMTAGYRGLDNLTLIIDHNGLQQGDTLANTNDIEPLADKFTAFGWSVRTIDGHDFEAILTTLSAAPFEPGKPNCIIALTHKGMGVSFMTDNVAWHHRVPNDAETAAAMAELKVKTLGAIDERTL